MKEYPIEHTTIVDGHKEMPTVWFLMGLPASGKSVWAKEKMNSTTVRINKDAIREMMGGSYSPEREAATRTASRATGIEALRRNLDIIIDDTNLSPKHMNFWKAECEKHKITLIKVFFNTPIDVCIERDAERPIGTHVSEWRIRDMWKTYKGEKMLREGIEYREQDTTLPEAVIVDIDGTLALADNRSPYDDTKLDTDLPHQPVIDLVTDLHDMGYYILILSGRQSTELCREQTVSWLDKHLPDVSHSLWMRAEGDMRKDSIVKKELFENHIDRDYNVKFVLDDRNQVVDMWRKELMLPCFQVNYGDF